MQRTGIVNLSSAQMARIIQFIFLKHGIIYTKTDNYLYFPHALVEPVSSRGLTTTMPKCDENTASVNDPLFRVFSATLLFPK